MFRSGLVAVMMLGIGLGAADMASAKDKPGNGNGKAKGSQVVDKPGKGPKAIPPGQIKRYTRGAKLPGDLKYKDIGDLSKWKLKPPGKGNRYIRVDNEILEVTRDLSTVVEAVGIVDDLLR